MGIKGNIHKNKIVMKTVIVQQMENVQSERESDIFLPLFDEEEMYNGQHTSMISDDLWKKFELPTPPLSPDHDNSDSLDLEHFSMAFDIDTEDLVMLESYETYYQEMLKDVESFAESPPGHDPGLETCLESNLIQDIMWSAPSKFDTKDSKVPAKDKHRLRCNSCSNPTNQDCVAPDEVLMGSNIGGSLSQTKIHNLGLETPSDSEEEIDVVTVEKQQQQVIIAGKRKYRSDDESSPESYRGSKTVTLKIEHKPTNSVHNITKCSSVRQRVECPTDVHNYSLPVTSLKRVHSYPSSPIIHKSKKLKRDISIPSDLRKVAQKLKSSVGSYCRNSSDSEDFNDVGKRTQHNVLERKRRTDLKNSFFNLRDSVPELEGQERAPKVTILRKAAQYIHRLIDEQRRQEREMEQLESKRDKLKRHLHKLRDY